MLHLYLSSHSTGDELDAVAAGDAVAPISPETALLRPVRRCLRAVVASRVWYVMAQLSYAMYLLNPIGVGVTLGLLLPQIGGSGMHFADPAWLAAACALAFAVSALLALFLYMLVERPMMGVVAMLQ